jgi:hypothetical protein
MYKYLIFIFTLYSLGVLAQKKDFPSDYPFVVVDRFYNRPDMEWKYNEFKLKDIHQSKNDIEIRLNIRTSRSLAQEVITVKNNKYDANLYYKNVSFVRYDYPDSIKKYGKWERFPFRKFHIKKGDLKLIYSKLLSYHLDHIPDQSDIDKKSFLTTYFLECKINNRFSTCYFGGKKELIDEYPNVQAFKDYVGIIAKFGEIASDYYDNALTLALRLDHV